MVEMQKPSKDKYGLGYTEDIASTSNNKIKNLGPQNDKMLSVEPATPVPSTTEPACSDEQNRLSAAKTENAEKAKILGSNIVKKNDSVLITRKPTLSLPKNNKQPPILKLGQGHGKSRIQTPHKTAHGSPNVLYPKSNYHQVGWNYGTQQEQQFQPPMYNQWGPYPPFPYMGQPNGSNKEDPWHQHQVIEGCRDKEKKGFHVFVFQTEAGFLDRQQESIKEFLCILEVHVSIAV
ncbi:hypothetical protein Tco_0565490 [Tanacetum coccineum]